MTVILLGLGKADEAGNEPILRLLDVLLSTDTIPDEKREILENDFDIPMTKEMREDANITCNLGEGIREEAEQKTKVNAVLSLMKILKLSVEDAVNALEVPAED